jgi:hypothetical protein
MVIIRPALRISGCAQGSSELSYRQVAARDYRVPEATDRHSVNSKATKKVKKVGYPGIQNPPDIAENEACKHGFVEHPVHHNKLIASSASVNSQTDM